MGVTLRETAHSVNIRERLDFSCAVFDRAGHLVANAPHVPVHLGSMGETVRAVLNRRPPTDGETCLINNPIRRWYAPAGHHRGDAGVHRWPARVPGRIAWPPCRRRRQRTGLHPAPPACWKKKAY